jgi:glycosyltransferase involved in cell wall biosynthesis
MPVFNAERFVAAATESVLAQTSSDFEFIILDDGSTDSSLSILKRYAESDQRIRLVSRPNRGLIDTLNEMISLSKGEFLARMDADDLCHPERFARQVEFLRHNDEVVVVGSRGLIIDPDGNPLREIPEHLSHEQINSALMTNSLGIIHPAAMMRRAQVLELGGYRAEFKHAEDLDLWLRLGERHRLQNLGEVLVSYRVHADSVSHTHRRAQSEAAWLAVDEARARRGLPPEKTRPPPGGELSTFDTLRMWGWWALGAANLRTARKHALQLVISQPLDTRNWKLLVCVVRDTLIRGGTS